MISKPSELFEEKIINNSLCFINYHKRGCFNPKERTFIDAYLNSFFQNYPGDDHIGFFIPQNREQSFLFLVLKANEFHSLIKEFSPIEEKTEVVLNLFLTNLSQQETKKQLKISFLIKQFVDFYENKAVISFLGKDKKLVCPIIPIRTQNGFDNLLKHLALKKVSFDDFIDLNISDLLTGENYFEESVNLRPPDYLYEQMENFGFHSFESQIVEQEIKYDERKHETLIYFNGKIITRDKIYAISFIYHVSQVTI